MPKNMSKGHVRAEHTLTVWHFTFSPREEWVHKKVEKCGLLPFPLPPRIIFSPENKFPWFFLSEINFTLGLNPKYTFFVLWKYALGDLDWFWMVSEITLKKGDFFTSLTGWQKTILVHIFENPKHSICQIPYMAVKYTKLLFVCQTSMDLLWGCQWNFLGPQTSHISWCFCSTSADEENRLVPSLYQSLNQSGFNKNLLPRHWKFEFKEQKSGPRLYPTPIEAPLWPNWGITLLWVVAGPC